MAGTPRARGPHALILSRTPRFFVDEPLRAGGSCALPEDAAHHAIHVMRLASGDDIVLFNGRGGEFPARIASIQKLRVLVDVLEHKAIERESPLQVTLVQAVSAGDKMDFTLRKAVELGAFAIQPVLGARSLARPKGDRAEARQAQWRRVVISACEQCGRHTVPEVLPLIDAAAYRPPAGALALLLTPRAEQPLSRALQEARAFIIAAGPEAGFTDVEEDSLVRAGFRPASMGPRVLRTETAALAAIAALNALRGDS